MEKGEWFPFKGTREKGETNEQAAIREIKEETCNVVKIDNIDLKCNYSTKRKHYHIGLVQINTYDINKFYQNREILLKNIKYNYYNQYYSYLEKTDVRMFSLDEILSLNLHDITLTPIKYYYSYLKSLQTKLNDSDNISPYLNSITKKYVNNMREMHALQL